MSDTLQNKFRLFLDNIFGAVADAATPFGTLMARIRSIAEGLGTTADTASATGSLLARLRLLLVDTVGATTDTASATGSLMARQRLIAQSYSSANLFTRWQNSNADTLSGTPAKLLGGMVWNNSNNIRYIQFFNRNTNPTNGTVPLISRPLAANEKYSLQPQDFGSNDGFNFTTGLAWGWSSTLGTYTAATNTEVAIEIYWRSI